MRLLILVSVCLVSGTGFAPLLAQDSVLPTRPVRASLLSDSGRSFSGVNIPVFSNYVFSDFGRVSIGDFHPVSTLIDSNVNVVVLEDVGRTELRGSFFGWRVKFTRYRRLLIRNKKGFDAAKIILPYHMDENGADKLPSLRASTWNLEEGRLIQTKVDTADMYVQNGREQFSFPNVREGSIIEYTYSINSGSIYSLHGWDFQGEYPRLKSEYTVTFPSAFNYVVSRQGQFAIGRSVDSSQETYVVGMVGIRALAYTIRWAMKDVPATQEEPYVFCADSHVSGIRFQLSEYTDIKTGKRTKVNDQWKMVSDQLLKNKAFGGVMTATSHWERKELRLLVGDSASGIGKAMGLFSYVRDHFTTEGRDILSDDRTLKEIFKSGKGNVAEINLMLTALLREEGLSADAVILSTRDNGLITPSYPLTENFNYVVVRLRIGDKVYFLDASEPKMGFGRLPLDCYNGYARVVSVQPDSVLLRTDSLIERRMGMAILTGNEAGDSILGDYTETEGYYQSHKIRQEIGKDGEKVYFENVGKTYPAEVRIMNGQVDSLTAYELPVTLRYSVGFPVDKEDHLYINPLMGQGMKDNPFSAARRVSPVELPFARNELFVVNLEIPKGYELEELPKSTRVKLNESEGIFEYLTAVHEDIIQLRTTLIIKKTYFDPEDYPALRDFFGMIVKKQAEMIVLRKKK